MSSPTEPERQRLFFALWPDAGLRTAVHHCSTHQAKFCGGRHIPLENLHVTLAFLGAVDTRQRGCMEAAAAAIDLPSFDLLLDQLGYWSRRGVLWLGSSKEIPPPLLELVAALQAAMASCDIPVDPRPFKLHLTLRRNARRAPQTRVIQPVPWPITSFALVESHTHASGARYHVLRRWPLGGGAV